MDENRFWNMIEDAWKICGGMTEIRQNLISGNASESDIESLNDARETVVQALKDMLSDLSQEDLLAFDRILERKLYDIDREDIHEFTDGSDDGFLYARGLIVAAGKGYYDAVNANPSIAISDLECEEMCYLSFHLYWDKYETPPPNSEISRESCSNLVAWPGLK